MANKTNPGGQIYQIKVSLLHTRPPIWRRLLVPANISLAALHAVLQIAFDWQDCHLHEFRIGRQRYGPLDIFEDGDNEGLLDESKFCLRDLVKKVGD